MDSTIWGTTLGSPIFGNSQMGILQREVDVRSVGILPHSRDCALDSFLGASVAKDAASSQSFTN